MSIGVIPGARLRLAVHPVVHAHPHVAARLARSVYVIYLRVCVCVCACVCVCMCVCMCECVCV